MNTVQRVVVVPEEEIGEIHPYLHGHFAEHLGELVYPGICVAPECGIANTNGSRNDVVEALRPVAARGRRCGCRCRRVVFCGCGGG